MIAVKIDETVQCVQGLPEAPIATGRKQGKKFPATGRFAFREQDRSGRGCDFLIGQRLGGGFDGNLQQFAIDPDIDRVQVAKRTIGTLNKQHETGAETLQAIAVIERRDCLTCYVAIPEMGCYAGRFSLIPEFGRPAAKYPSAGKRVVAIKINMPLDRPPS